MTGVKPRAKPRRPQRRDDGPESRAPARYWRPAPGDPKRVECTLCPRRCRLRAGQRGFCFVRSNQDGQLVTSAWGRSTGFAIDPIEKKPLNHFLPGTPVLSFGTAGCNLGCKFCQNWDISKSREVARLSAAAGPQEIAAAAVRVGARSVAFTYNDPVTWIEYAVDTARACHDAGLQTVAVTAGYIEPAPRRDLFAHMDAVNVDLKAFTEGFYRSLCAGHLAPVLDTLQHLRDETDAWVEVTTLLIPGENDTDDEVSRLAGWVAAHLGPDTPLHLSAFHPTFRLRDRPRTPLETLRRARRLAQREGLRYVYTGNVHDPEGDATRCPGCGAVCIQRDWYELLAWRLDEAGRCAACGTPVAGVFEATPGAWGAKRAAVSIR